VEQSPVSIVITDLRGIIEYVNPRFELVTGYTRAEVLGQNPRILKSGERTPEDYHHLWNTIASGGEWHGEFHNRKKNGELFWEYASISPVRNAEGVVTHYVAVKEDITERKRLERELEQLVYVTSHDLRSPLVNIQGFSKELERSFTEIHSAVAGVAGLSGARLREVLDHDVPEAFRYIYASTRKMDALIDGLLRLSRLGRGALSIRPVDMQALIQGVLQTFEYTVQQKGVAVNVGMLPPCRGDEIQINQLFSNLVDNALKYLDPCRPGRIDVDGKVNGSMAVYEVRDNGVGIAPEHKEQIFELFHRLQPSVVEGEGLGLTVARKIVDRHGGTITVSSTP
jgi:PAS domain S-box-containing protein